MIPETVVAHLSCQAYRRRQRCLSAVLRPGGARGWAALLGGRLLEAREVADLLFEQQRSWAYTEKPLDALQQAHSCGRTCSPTSGSTTTSWPAGIPSTTSSASTGTLRLSSARPMGPS